MESFGGIFPPSSPLFPMTLAGSPPPPRNMPPRARQRFPAKTGTDHPPNPNHVPPGSAKTHRSHLGTRSLRHDTPRGHPGSRHGEPPQGWSPPETPSVMGTPPHAALF